MICLSRFHTILPAYESSQENTLEWLVEAHTQAEDKAKGLKDPSLFRSEIRDKLNRVGCKPHHINKRAHILPDFLHKNWALMEIYQLEKTASGVSLEERMNHYRKHAEDSFQSFYEHEPEAPDNLIHVTCTGYLAPSPAQRLVSQKGWGEKTTVTHAYHMGCYGAIPAIRMASGFLKNDKRTDIVHTEMCSLHSNPSQHDLDQLLTQSLFADGFIKYSVSDQKEEPHLKVLSCREEIIPDSSHLMSWELGASGFQMSLSKEVATSIAQALNGYLERLIPEKMSKTPLFAIHPGGPKIVQHIQKLLKLENEQISHSKHILFDRGNMSSATLPHIWEAILNDERIQDKTPIISLAFGPGLSIAGCLMEKSCGQQA